MTNVHTTRNTERIKNNIYWSSICKEWHIFNWQNLGDNAFVTVASCEFVTILNLSLLCNVNPNYLVNTGRKIVTIFKILKFYTDYFSTFTVWNFE